MKKAKDLDPSDFQINQELNKLIAEFSKIKSQNNENSFNTNLNKNLNKISEKNLIREEKKKCNCGEQKIEEKKDIIEKKNSIEKKDDIEKKDNIEKKDTIEKKSEDKPRKKKNITEEDYQNFIESTNLNKKYDDNYDYELSYEINPDASVPKEIEELGK